MSTHRSCKAALCLFLKPPETQAMTLCSQILNLWLKANDFQVRAHTWSCIMRLSSTFLRNKRTIQMFRPNIWRMSACFEYVCLPACLPTCLSVCLSDSLHVCLYEGLSVFLSVWLTACLSVCLTACISVCLKACVSVCLSDSLHVFLSVWPPACLSVWRPPCLSVWRPACLSVCLTACTSVWKFVCSRWDWRIRPRIQMMMLSWWWHQTVASVYTHKLCSWM